WPVHLCIRVRRRDSDLGSGSLDAHSIVLRTLAHFGGRPSKGIAPAPSTERTPAMSAGSCARLSSWSLACGLRPEPDNLATRVSAPGRRRPKYNNQRRDIARSSQENWTSTERTCRTPRERRYGRP